VNVEVMPENIKTVKTRIYKQGKYLVASVNLPAELVRRHNLANGQRIVICYLCKEGEDVCVNKNTTPTQIK